MDRDGLGGRRAVSSVVGGGERANDHVVASRIASSGLTRDFNCHLAAVVRGGGVVHRHLVGALHRVVRRDEGELRRRGVLDRDGLCSRRAVSSVVSGGERANDHVVARGISSRRLARDFDCHLAAVVRGGGVVHGHLIRALNRVVGSDEGELRSSRVLDRDGLGCRAAVSSVVGRRERANDHVVARGIASSGLAGDFDGDLTAVVGGGGVVHGHLVGALYRVVGRNEGELRCRGILDRDGLGGRAAVASVVGGGEGARDGVVARGVAGSGFAGDFDRHLTAVVRRRGVVHRHRVGALDCVVGGHKGELWRCGVYNGNELGSRGRVALAVCCGKCSGQKVFSRAHFQLQIVTHREGDGTASVRGKGSFKGDFFFAGNRQGLWNVYERRWCAVHHRNDLRQLTGVATCVAGGVGDSECIGTGAWSAQRVDGGRPGH